MSRDKGVEVGVLLSILVFCKGYYALKTEVEGLCLMLKQKTTPAATADKPVETVDNTVTNATVEFADKLAETVKNLVEQEVSRRLYIEKHGLYDWSANIHFKNRLTRDFANFLKTKDLFIANDKPISQEPNNGYKLGRQIAQNKDVLLPLMHDIAQQLRTTKDDNVTIDCANNGEANIIKVWNGDASNQTENPETGVEIFLNPPKSAGYCSDIPLLWNNGNHDFRGIWNRSLDRFMMVRLPSERDSRDWALSRNWAVRQGDIAMIGLDTGEDKPDAHPQFVGLVNSEPYRIAQTQWLRDQFERPEIKSAPHKVAFCHIPLFDSNPVSNPGDVVGDGNGRYKPDFAVWQRQCANLWAPIFKENGVKLLIAAHCHNYRFDPATPDRPWAQIVGGGCSESPTNSYATVIEGRVEDGKLKITVHNVNAGTIAGEHVF